MHYTVFETNADFEEISVVYGSHCKDIAETKMVLLHEASEYQKDFMLLQTVTRDPVSASLSTKTLHLRGECSS